MRIKIEKRHLILVSLIGLIVFLLLINFAMEENDNGYSFFENVISQLGESDDNTLIIFAVAMIIFGLSVSIAYFLLGKRGNAWDLHKFGILLGVLAGLFFVIVTIFPLDTQGELHLVVVLLAYICLFFSSVILARVYYPRVIAYPFIILAIGIVLYLIVNVFGFALADVVIQAVSQKLIFYLIILVVFFIIAFVIWKNYRKERYWLITILFLILLLVILLFVAPIQQECIFC